MILNPNKEKVKQIKEALKLNDGYCPCMIERNQGTKCPCLRMRTENKCYCGLFVENKIIKGDS